MITKGERWRVRANTQTRRRIRRSLIYLGEGRCGYQANKRRYTYARRYFYALMSHLMITQAGKPVEIFLTPGE